MKAGDVSDLTKALTALNAAASGYEEADEFFDGRAPEVFASARVRRALRGTGAKFRVNWARTTVTACLNRLKINAITSADPGVQAAIDDLLTFNQFWLYVHDVHEAGLKYGETYVMVWDADDDPDSQDVAIDHNSPLTVRVFYDRANPRRKRYAMRAWVREEDGKTRLDLYYPDRVERYVSKVPLRSDAKPDDANYDRYFDDDSDEWPIVNPYGRVPVFHFRTQLPQGRPEHCDAYGPQNALNKLVVAQMSTVEAQSFPQRWALVSATSSRDDTPADEFFSDGDDDDAATAGGTIDANLVSAPGSIQELEGVSEVGQWDAAEPRNFLEPIRFYIEAMAQTTDTPMHAYQLGGQPPTGESRRRAEQPLVDKVGMRQLSFGSTWREAIGFALLIKGFSEEQAESVTIEWEPAERSDDVEAFALVEAKVASGVPRRQALLEAGYTVAQLDGWGVVDLTANPTSSHVSSTAEPATREGE